MPNESNNRIEFICNDGKILYNINIPGIKIDILGKNNWLLTS